MDAQLIVIFQNGYAEAREPMLRDRREVVDIAAAKDIKNVIWTQLKRMDRQGHVVVKWNGQMYVCEMKQDRKGYTRVEVDYHPDQGKFTL